MQMLLASVSVQGKNELFLAPVQMVYAQVFLESTVDVNKVCYARSKEYFT